MKRKNTIWSLVLALVMVLGVIAPLSALASSTGTTETEPKTITVNVHKILMSKKILKEHDMDKKYDPTKAMTEDDLNKFFNPKGQDSKDPNYADYKDEVVKQIDGVYFVAIKEGEDHYADFDKLSAKAQEEAVKKIADGRKGLTSGGGVVAFVLDNNANYKIYEVKSLSTYKGDKKELLADQKAVPISLELPKHARTATGVASEIHVYPKNTQNKPQIDKNFKSDNTLEARDEAGNKHLKDGANYDNYEAEKAKAKAKIGDNIPYEVKTKIEAGSSYERLVWNDIMTNGLTFNTEEGKDYSLKITADNNSGITFTAADYDLQKDDNGFRLALTEAGLTKIKNVTQPEDRNAAKDVEITLTYSAKVNASAKADIAEKNNVTLEYGHKPGKEFEKKTVTPKDGNLKVTKNFGDGAKTDDLKLVYTLEKNGKVEASVSLDNTITTGTIDLGNGIKFNVTGAFKGTFTGLDDDATWTISERVAGFNPAYAETNNPGEVTITNNEDKDNPPPLNPTEPEVYVGGKRFVKTSQDKQKDGTEKFDRLEGAKFVVKNGDKYLVAKSTVQVGEVDAVKDAKTALDEAVKAYNDEKDEQKRVGLKATVDEKQTKYNEAVKSASTFYEWGEKKDAVVFVSDAQGQFEINGLEYGDFQLEEIEAPKGYAKLTETTPFKVDKDTYKVEAGGIEYKVENKADGMGKRIKNTDLTIPQTGGMGTALFMVVGVALMGGAFIAMRKRSAEQA